MKTLTAALMMAAACQAGEAEFIGAGAEALARPAIVAKDVVNAKEVVRAGWRVTGLGVFTASVNGKDAGGSFLAPGYTHFKKRRMETALDVTPLWRAAKGATNELAALCTAGWWCDRIAGKNGGTWPAFRGILTLDYADGTRETFPTDASWRVSTETPVTTAGIWEGEEYDARITPANWSPAKVSREFTGGISPWIGPPVVLREDLALAPDAAAFDLKPGETNIIDFGQNAAAVPRFAITAAPGTRFTVRLGEMLNDGIKDHNGDGPAGSLYLANMRGAGAKTVYIARGEDDSFTPLHTFYGYRYAEVSANAPVKGRIASIPVSSVSAAMERGSLTTGRDDVNRLVKNAYWGMLSNFLSIPTDCPQRTERYGWTGDTQVFAKTGAYFADISGFMRKWMQDVRDSQAEDGTVPLVCPVGSWDTKGPMAGWSDAIVIVPWTMWRYLGDEETIRENWDAMARYVERIAKDGYTSKRGDWLLCDWLSFEKLSVDNRTRWSNGGYTEDHLTYQNYLNACHLLQDAEIMEEMAAVVKRDAAPYRDLAAKTRERILATWFKPDGTLADLFSGMQTPALFALKLHLGDRGKLSRALVEAIHANGDRLATGFLGTPILCEVLSDIGETPLAYTILLQHDFPSWLYSVDQGATTIWERWNGYTKDKGFGPVSMNSFNHYAYGAVVAWLFEHAAGIKPGPGGDWRHPVIAPEPDPRLGSIDAALATPCGTIRSAWRYDENGNLILGKNTEARDRKEESEP